MPAPPAARAVDVVGSTVVPQIIVGKPSHATEPVAISGHFRSLPFRPDTTIDGWSTDALTVRGVSQRGHLHRFNGSPRQDDFAVHQLPDGRIIAAVADGVSGARQSHLGATLAIRSAAEWLRTNLAGDITRTDWSLLYKSAAWQLAGHAKSLFELDEPDPVRAEQELSTTLVCAVIDPVAPGMLRAYLTGVGDSGAWLFSSGTFTKVLGGKAISESGLASAAVTALPWTPTDGLEPVVVDLGNDDVLLLGTDGIGDPLGDGQGGVGNLLRAVLCSPAPPSLIEFAHAVDFSRELFDDDRTLVAVWPRTSTHPSGSESRPSGQEVTS